jgi:hypothetical protein
MPSNSTAGQAFEPRLPRSSTSSVTRGLLTHRRTLPAFVACDRLSLNALKCIDCVVGSCAVSMSACRFEGDRAQPFITRAKPPGYRLTGTYTPHVYYGSP